MDKNKKSKKNNIEKVRMILDNISLKKLKSKDIKLISLKERIEQQSSENKVIYGKIDKKNEEEDESDSLKPSVTIHARKRLEIKPISSIEKKEEPETEQEDLFEVVKTKYPDPEFQEIIPIEPEKEEKVETKEPESEEIKEFEEIPSSEIKEFKEVDESESTEKFAEWEPFEIKKQPELEKDQTKDTKDKESKPETGKKKEEKTVKDKKICPKCGNEIKSSFNFCPICGSDLDIEKKRVEEEKELPNWEPIEKEELEEKTEKKEPEEFSQVIPTVEIEKKVEVFRDIDSIDDETAVLLYDAGYTTIDLLEFATAKDLRKIKGIKRKQSKTIIKEIDEKNQWKISKEIVNEKPVEIERVEEDSDLEKVDEAEEKEPIQEEKEDKIEDDVKIDAFKDFQSIDEKTAITLYDNGYTSFDSLEKATIKDLIGIQGIKKRKAKKILKEIDKKIIESAEIKSIPIGESAKGEIPKKIVEKKEKEEDEEKEEIEPTPVELTKNSEWEPVDTEIEEKTEEEIIKPIEEKTGKNIKNEKAIEIFKDIKSITSDLAVLLYKNGIESIEDLEKTTLKKLRKIKGIDKKLAKNIKDEVENIFSELLSDVEDGDTPEEYFQEELVEEDAEEIDANIKDFKEPKQEPEEEIFETEGIEEIPIKLEDEKDVFSEIDSIDEKIARLLKENGIDSIAELRNKTIKDLTKIRGIRKKIAKKIKKEVENLHLDEEEDTYEFENNPFIKEDEDEWEYFDKEKVTKLKKKKFRGFQYKDYTLYEKKINTKSGDKRVVRFFSKGEPEDSKPIDIPNGYEIKENKKTGVPYLKKKK